MAIQGLRPEQVTEQNRRRIREAIANKAPRTWITVTDGGKDYAIRSGHPIRPDDHVRLTTRPVDGPACEICLGTRWVPVTRVVSRTKRGDENLADRLLCKTCGGTEIPDERETDE